ncbi:RagB/SusD family nutrient uptake outer membrane protein [Weeksellaceae bacterium TAE3-ERU29]|nr:RagB/SusD family nutrient uptake outer membrane protein [Weeksellaceae bacterium TAE3-ERU29]
MKKLIYIIVGGLVLNASSCSEDWLNLEPTNAIPIDKAFSTQGTFEAAVVGIYNRLQSANGFGNLSIEAADLRGEDMILKQRNNWGISVDLYNYSYVPTNSQGNAVFFNMYQVIEACNSILDVDAEGKISLPDAVKNPLLGEVKTIRALAYFDLVRLFCQPYAKDNGASPGIPLRTTADVNLDKERGTVKEVYDLILEDLNYAVKTLNVSNNTDRVDLTFAQGLLARVYLTIGDNQKATEFAELAINSAPPLTPDFYKNGVSQKNPSIIFSLQYTTNTYDGYNSYSSFLDYGWQDGGGYGTMGATEEFYKKYSKNDLRKSWFVNRWVYENKIDNSLTWTDIEQQLQDKDFYEQYAGTYFPAGLWDNSIGGISEENMDKLRVQMFDNDFFRTVSMYGKFPRVDAIRAEGYEATPNAGTPNLGNIPMMRSPELYLIVAESSALRNDYGKAKTYLQAVQNNANAEVFNGDNSKLLEAIRLERRKELVGEGFRIFDIIRQQQIINRKNYWGPAENATIDPTKANSKVYLPIPQKEIDSNSKISQKDQNPAY